MIEIVKIHEHDLVRLEHLGRVSERGGNRLRNDGKALAIFVYEAEDVVLVAYRRTAEKETYISGTQECVRGLSNLKHKLN